MKKSHKIESYILTELLKAGSECVSGAMLADHLSISRSAIWGRLEKLRKEGFKFEATPNRGYRLRQEPNGLHPSLLYAYLKIKKISIPFQYFPEIDSTNAEANRWLADGKQTPFVVVADKQTHGRGRLGRQWHSPSEGNIYFSFAFQPRLPPTRMQAFTLWAGMNLCKALRKHTQMPLGVKWPNDLFLSGRKVGGMLTEARVDSDWVHSLIFGLGLNVNSDCSAWEGSLPEIAHSLSMEAGKPIAMTPLAVRVITTVLEAYDEFISSEDCLSRLLKEWKDYDVLAGHLVNGRSGNQALEGIARGIDEQGALCIRLNSGQVAKVHAGEVSLQYNLSKGPELTGKSEN